MIYLISLEQRANQLLNRPVIVEPAVDTRRDADVETWKSKVDPHSWKQLVKARKDGFRTSHESLTNGAVGCYLSHANVWSRLRPGDIAMIIEEDALVPKSLVNMSLPPRHAWDIILLGCIDLRPTSCNKSGWRRVTHFLQTHAYIIQGDAAHRILTKHAFPIKKQLDWMLSELAATNRIQILGYFPGLVKQDSRRKTTIQVLPVRGSGGKGTFSSTNPGSLARGVPGTNPSLGTRPEPSGSTPRT